MTTRTSLMLAAGLASLAGCSPPDPMEDPQIAAACDKPPFRTNDARAAAMERGHTINRQFDCIEKGTFELNETLYASPEAAEARRLMARLMREAEQAVADNAAAGGANLREARAQFRTQVSRPSGGMPLPSPPAALFVRGDYESAVGKLPAWVSPDPGDGEKHPAIVWITGGDSNSLDDFWTEGGPQNDQSAGAFRKAGLVMMFPTLRGGNANPGGKEFFYGEVDDVIAAAEHLARLPYVGSVYLGGHSTGGTLAVLVAETSNRFAGVFAFGPVSTVDGYPESILPVDFTQLPELELKLRSPIYWLGGITSPTYLIEGTESPGNNAELQRLCARSHNPRVHCIPVPGKDHFSVLDAASKKIAARLAVGLGDDRPLLRPEEFAR